MPEAGGTVSSALRAPGGGLPCHSGHCERRTGRDTLADRQFCYRIVNFRYINDHIPVRISIATGSGGKGLAVKI